MGVLTVEQLAELRRKIAEGQAQVTWDKPTVNAALQAIEDFFEANRVSLSAAIDAATLPFAFSGPQKKRLVAYWMLQKFGREGV